MFQDPHGPIEAFEWGVFTVEGQRHGDGEGVGKDIRMLGPTVSEWKERKGHLLTLQMVTGVFDRGVEVLIIGNGVHGALTCSENILSAIRDKGIPDVRVRRTPDACREYNELVRGGKKAALLAHGTC